MENTSDYLMLGLLLICMRYDKKVCYKMWDYIPKTVAEMLVKRKEEQEEYKDIFGDEYTDYKLVFAMTNGRPMEGQVINRAFRKLINDHGLPKVVFHSLRHSSITYKLKLNGGDMKAVQGDSGHAQVKMVADVYSHIIDDDRCLNAQRLEEEFYNKEEALEKEMSEEEILVRKLLENPEMAAVLKALVNNM